jgi:hypothetical protein
MHAHSESGHGLGSDVVAPEKVETPNAFFSWFAEVENEMDREQEAGYRYPYYFRKKGDEGLDDHVCTLVSHAMTQASFGGDAVVSWSLRRDDQ